VEAERLDVLGFVLEKNGARDVRLLQVAAEDARDALRAAFTSRSASRTIGSSSPGSPRESEEALPFVLNSADAFAHDARDADFCEGRVIDVDGADRLLRRIVFEVRSEFGPLGKVFRSPELERDRAIDRRIVVERDGGSLSAVFLFYSHPKSRLKPDSLQIPGD
jgi:hypothetical protein